MIRFKIIFTLLVSSLILNAQKAHKEDVMFLKNGSVIRGAIIDTVAANVRIKTEHGNIWAFDENAIDSITRDKVVVDTPPGLFRYYYNVTNFGVLAGKNNSESSHPISIQMVNGVYIKKYITAGVGLGIELFKESIAPLFIDSRVILSNQGKYIPFLYTQGGYSFILDDRKDEDYFDYNSKGGPMFGLGAGTIFVTGSGNGFMISVGYRFQELSHIITPSWGATKISRYEEYSRLEIKMGLYFD